MSSFHVGQSADVSPAREPDTFRRLVQKEITVEEYLADLKRRVDDRENGDSAEREGDDEAEDAS